MGEKTGSNPTDRGKSGVKRSVLTEGHGVPIGVTIEGAQRYDMKLVRSTIESIVVERPEPTEGQPQGMCLDKGYDCDEVYATLQAFVWVVERTHSWLNRFRHLLIRWDKKPENYLAFLHFACGLIAFRVAGLFG